MKHSTAIVRGRIHATRQWIFRWRGLDGTPFRGFLALLITFGVFSLFAATVRIRVSAPQQWVERKASIIHLPGGEEGKMWALRAQEGGPYPARFDATGWEKAAGLTSGLIDATRLSPEPYEPRLRELPVKDAVPSIPLADKEERVFPKPPEPPATVPGPPVKYVRVPVIYPLSGITSADIPAILPVFDAAKAAGVADASRPAEFVLLLRPAGTVLSCWNLSGQVADGAIADWLSGLDFGPEAAKKSPIIAVSVGFTNQPADGPDAR